MTLATGVLPNGDIIVGQFEMSGTLHEQTVIELKEPVLIKHVNSMLPKPSKIVGQFDPIALVIKVCSPIGVGEIFLSPQNVMCMGVVRADDPLYKTYWDAIAPDGKLQVNA